MTGDGEKQTIGQIGEEGLVRRLLEKLPGSSSVAVGPGDDCAVIETPGEWWQLLKTDCIVEGIHFVAGTDPFLVGRKAMNRTISDIAAMGGLPEYALVTIASHGGREVAEVEAWYDGMVAASEEFGCTIVGGETTSLPQPGAILSVAMSGKVEPEKCVLRSGARVGDRILVTGKLGGSFQSGRHLDFTPRIQEARWLVENARPSAMMDLSDGPGSDLPRLAEASAVGYRIDSASLPLSDGVGPESAVRDGEDYELLLTMSPKHWEVLPKEWAGAFPGTPLTCIGMITEEIETPLGKGWEHYCES